MLEFYFTKIHTLIVYGGMVLYAITFVLGVLFVFFSKYPRSFLTSAVLLSASQYVVILANILAREFRFRENISYVEIVLLSILTTIWLLFWVGLAGFVVVAILKIRKKKYRKLFYVSSVCFLLGVAYYVITELAVPSLNIFTPSCAGTFAGCPIGPIPSLE